MKKPFIITLFSIFYLFSCSKNADYVNPQSDIIGYVKLYDASGIPLEDNSGVSIIAEQNGKTLSTNSDKAGKFTFSKLETGTYNFTYSGVNIPTTKKYGVVHTGIGTNFIGSLNISNNPDFKINSFEAKVAFTGAYNLLGTYSKSESRTAIVFFSKSSNVSKENNIHSQAVSLTNGQFSTSNWASSNLTSRGFVLGETIYAIAYPTALYTNAYIDSETGKLIYPALGEPSGVKSFVLQ
ncbi:hypothetical protein ABID42_000979 [Arcicella rosea]|uniref:carboxypeptidase-like regulatory domain-containing protein n=1 Tax=Arcicella rosea TaxID=502909 RepID=UPI00345D5678